MIGTFADVQVEGSRQTKVRTGVVETGTGGGERSVVLYRVIHEQIDDVCDVAAAQLAIVLTSEFVHSVNGPAGIDPIENITKE